MTSYRKGDSELAAKVGLTPPSVPFVTKPLPEADNQLREDVVALALRVIGESPESCSHETIAAMSRINWDDVSIALPDEWKQALEN